MNEEPYKSAIAAIDLRVMDLNLNKIKFELQPGEIKWSKIS